MDAYVTGAIIRQLREEKGMTQAELAEKLSVSDKAVSRWETGRGYPDITLIEPLASVLGVSVSELLAGASVTNRNRAFNMLRAKFYVCPVCENVLFASGEAAISCCGITLTPLETEEADAAHTPVIEKIEDEYYVTLPHEMSKEHYISFIAAMTDAGIQIVKLYPEGSAEAYFKRSRVRYLYWYCNRDGMFGKKI